MERNRDKKHGVSNKMSAEVPFSSVEELDECSFVNGRGVTGYCFMRFGCDLGGREKQKDKLQK